MTSYGTNQSTRRRRNQRARTAKRSLNRATQQRARTTRRRTRERSQMPLRNPAQSRRKAQGTGRVTAVDGFRALAILAVLCYHLDVAWLPSGHLGVIMFLVLTGYLVTSSLLRRLRDGFGAIPRFWVNRLARIWPSCALMIALVVLGCVAFDHVLLTKARPDIVPGLTLCENISYILRNVSYFEQIGGPSPLTHLWYLGIDAQFCLVWPLVMLGCAVLPSRATTRRLCLVLAVASAVAMGVLYNPDAGVTRVYYGPDTRAFAPLVGAWLAYAMPLGKRPARDLRDLIEAGRLGIELAALVSFLILVVAMVLIPDTSVLLYRGGMFLASLLCAVILMACVLPGGLVSRLLSLPPLVWLGSRSFGIYLWHFPLIQIFHAASNGCPWWKVLLVVVLSVLLGELSYELVEQPIASGALAQAISPTQHNRVNLRGPLSAVAIALVAVIAADGIGLALIPEETLVPEDAIVSTGDAADKAMDLSAKEKSKDADDGADDGDEADQPGTNPDDVASDGTPDVDVVIRAPKSETKKGLYDPVLIGDSVPGDAEAFWNETFPDGLLDSYVGRRPDQALEVLKQYLDQGVVGQVVILQAFSNVPATNDELEQMVAACGSDRTIYIVNVRIPESEETAINQSLAACVSRHDNVHLIDWHALSYNGADWIYPDGEHLTPTGQPIYIGMLADAVASDIATIGGTVTTRTAGESVEGSGMSVVTDTTG